MQDQPRLLLGGVEMRDIVRHDPGFRKWLEFNELHIRTGRAGDVA